MKERINEYLMQNKTIEFKDLLFSLIDERKLTDSEVRKLMDELLKLPNPFTCPHGRPTAIKYTKYDLERKFSRK